MAKASQPRVVQCYHCRAPFEVSARAMTVACAKCGRRVIVHHVKVKDAQGVTKLQTCGHITIEKRGTVIAQLVEAHEGLEVLGTLEAKQILVRGPCKLGPKATVKGDIKAEVIEIDPGAKIKGGRFQIALDPMREAFELDELPGVKPRQSFITASRAKTHEAPARVEPKPRATPAAAIQRAPAPATKPESKPEPAPASKTTVKKKKVLRKKTKKKVTRKAVGGASA